MIEAILAAYITVQSPPSDCAPFARLIPGLRAKYKEAPFLRGVTDKGTMMLLTLNPATGTWTVIEVTPDMQASAVRAWSQFPLCRMGRTHEMARCSAEARREICRRNSTKNKRRFTVLELH